MYIRLGEAIVKIEATLLRQSDIENEPPWTIRSAPAENSPTEPSPDPQAADRLK